MQPSTLSAAERIPTFGPEDLNPFAVEDYLRAQGWKQVTQTDESSSWERSLRGQVVEVLVPYRMSWRDYGRRVSDVLAVLAQVEGRCEHEVARDVAAGSALRSRADEYVPAPAAPEAGLERLLEESAEAHLLRYGWPSRDRATAYLAQFARWAIELLDVFPVDLAIAEREHLGALDREAAAEGALRHARVAKARTGARLEALRSRTAAAGQPTSAREMPGGDPDPRVRTRMLLTVQLPHGVVDGRLGVVLAYGRGRIIVERSESVTEASLLPRSAELAREHDVAQIVLHRDSRLRGGEVALAAFRAHLRLPLVLVDAPTSKVEDLGLAAAGAACLGCGHAAEGDFRAGDRITTCSRCPAPSSTGGGQAAHARNGERNHAHGQASPEDVPPAGWVP